MTREEREKYARDFVEGNPAVVEVLAVVRAVWNILALIPALLLVRRIGNIEFEDQTPVIAGGGSRCQSRATEEQGKSEN